MQEMRTNNNRLSLAIVFLFLCNLFIVPCALLNQLGLDNDFISSVVLESEGDQSILVFKKSMLLPDDKDGPNVNEGKDILEINGNFYTLLERNIINDTLCFTYIKISNAREIFSLLSDKICDMTSSEVPPDSNNRTLLNSWMHLKFRLNEVYTFTSSTLNYNSKAATNFSYIIVYQSISLGFNGPPPKAV